MDILANRINRRTLGGITLGAAATSGLAYLVSAQDATPETDVEMAEATPVSVSQLSELESANQVDVIANKSSYAAYVSGENQPGWYVFNVSNESGADASFNLAQLPEDVSVSDFSSLLFQITSGSLEELPEWYGDVQFVGGTYMPVDGENSVLVNLSAGEWVIFSSHTSSKQRPTTIKVLSAEETVTMGSEPAATPEGGEVAPEGFGSSFTLSVTDSGIDADAEPAAGYSIIGVRNDASSAANFVMIHSAGDVDEAAAADLAKSWIAGEEVDAAVVGGMGVLSPDVYGYIELDAEMGTYIGFSSMVNTEGGSQVDDGAIVLLSVS